MKTFTYDFLQSSKIHVWCADVCVEPGAITVGLIYFAPFCQKEEYVLKDENNNDVFRIKIPQECLRQDKISIFTNRTFEGKCLL